MDLAQHTNLAWNIDESFGKRPSEVFETVQADENKLQYPMLMRLKSAITMKSDLESVDENLEFDNDSEEEEISADKMR